MIGWAPLKRLPLGLTLVALIAFAALIGLGAWQLHRLSWKTALLVRIDALRHAPPRPIETLAAQASRGTDVGFVRTSAVCAPSPAAAAPIYRYAVREGQVAWRLVSPCRLAVGGYDGILLDRGVVDRFTGAMAPGPVPFTAPKRVVGVLRRVEGGSSLDPDHPIVAAGMSTLRNVDIATLGAIAPAAGLSHPMPYLLAVESEAPAPAGVTPAALPQDIPNNHFVYALTWFSLAGILVWFYVALVWRRMRAR